MLDSESINEKSLSTSFFSQLYKKSLDAIVILNNKDEIVHANNSFLKLFGYTLREVKDNDVNKLIVPTELIIEARSLSNEALHQDIVRKETKRRKKDGTEIWVSLIGIPIVINADSKGLFVIYQDISKTVESKLNSEEASRIKAALIANMSHEFRTPLNAIMGFSEILREELINSDHKNMINDVHSSAKRLLNTLNSVLELSQLESADFQPVIKEVNVIDEVNKICEKYKKYAQEKNLDFIVSEDLKDIFCHIDVDIFRQIITNIIDNAVKYTHHGSINIKTLCSGEECSISVCDTGIGILKEHHNLIFNEFRQVSEGINRNYEGTGLGLTLAKKMIEILNGRIHLESEYGRGSTFTIVLPLSEKVKNASSNQLLQSSESQEIPGDVKKKVLLVEDNKTNKILIRRFLQNDFDVEEASSGDEALNLISKNKYEIILMDINLGYGISGIEVAAEIRKHSGYENVPVIAVTGYALATEKNAILSSGINGYVSKPFTKEQLTDVLKKSLAQFS